MRVILHFTQQNLAVDHMKYTQMVLCTFTVNMFDLFIYIIIGVVLKRKTHWTQSTKKKKVL